MACVSQEFQFSVHAWVKTFVAKKAQSVITDIAKLDVVSDGFLHNQLLNFCQNARMVFLGITVCKQGMTVFSKTSYTEFHKPFQHHTYKGEHKARPVTRLEVKWRSKFVRSPFIRTFCILLLTSCFSSTLSQVL